MEELCGGQSMEHSEGEEGILSLGCFVCDSLLICFFADFFSSHPPCYLWRERGAGRRALLSSLCRESEKPRGASQMWIAL